MIGNAILNDKEPDTDTIHSLLFNARECGAKEARIYRSFDGRFWTSIWSTDQPPQWMKSPQEWVNDSWE